MTQATTSSGILGKAELTDLTIEALCALGLARDDAAEVATILVLADLFGLRTHGTSRIESYGARLRIGGIKARPVIRAEQLGPALHRLDGDNGVGPLVGYRALQLGMKAAREQGIACVLVRGSNHFGPVSPYSYLAAEQGFASIIGSNATTTIAPWGGTDARLGNSPVGFGVPNPGGRPFMLDMAISVAARARIRNALKRGESIPGDWATDAQGRPTTDPKAALDGFLLPIGGHKGYGLALVVDLLAGLLSGAAYLTHVKSWEDEPDQPQDLGHFFILIDTRRLGSGAWLAQRMGDHAAILHGSAAADPAAPVVVPGEIELARLERQMRDGIDIGEAQRAMLEAAAGIRREA
ncbi:Ldh family oxidoreductase [Burkholderia gladioli]|uniref:Ldh family oxidoreductase n=1 Tax=Burkholderia gladioli TaxID=28095 RepID=UPI000BBD2077|nr:Ldh family oxidoreductase [Burkholderia gladioli]ATF84257.1 hydroxyacid dehydrogenase [Burkholderia gladioli pv. gladioli]MBJ9714429.1 Ldh family oxidoreductase [Burkholderia gladioli]MBU9157311.1 Ldh family oxidoreductase [Burkholderia gladioli]MCH7274347.1 Ldh family oxidoreductase [Burkholderia gladioli]MDR8091405.1 Ldh family oxidoreductase [Burkholderia gladioli]